MEEDVVQPDSIPENLKDIPPESVLFVPYTPNSGLKKELQMTEKQFNKNGFGKVKVVETLGPKLNNQLSNTAPWSKEHCGRTNCTPCKTKTGNCLKRNVTYKIKCGLCPFLYIGETHRTFFDRSLEHSKALQEDDPNNALVKHMKLHHPGEEPVFNFHLHRVWKTSLARQIGEALAISEVNQDLLMNSKSEWGSTPIPRVIIRYPETPEDSPTPPPNPPAADTQPPSPRVIQNTGRKKRKAVRSPTPPSGPTRGPMDLFLASQPRFSEARNEQIERIARYDDDGNESN